MSIHDEAHAARREVENVLDAAGWPWSLGLSHWMDTLLVIEEAASS